LNPMDECPCPCPCCCAALAPADASAAAVPLPLPLPLPPLLLLFLALGGLFRGGGWVRRTGGRLGPPAVEEQRVRLAAAVGGCCRYDWMGCVCVCVCVCVCQWGMGGWVNVKRDLRPWHTYIHTYIHTYVNQQTTPLPPHHLH
jgi:hypothetical protein